MSPRFQALVSCSFVALSGCAGAPAAASPPAVPPPAPSASSPASSGCASEAFAEELVRLVRKSPIVFRGTVLRVGATKGIAAQPTSVVVRVDRLFRDEPRDRYVGSAEARQLESPDRVLGSLAGEEITVVAAGVAPAAGVEAYFFAESRTWGQSVEVVELDRRMRDAVPDYEGQIPRLRKALLDRAVFDRMSSADAVVVGTVSAILPRASGGIVSEHAPLWTDAAIDVRRALRGNPAHVTVRFSASVDVCCSTMPKLVQGEQAVFVLHRGQDGSYSLAKGDVLPVADEGRLRAVLACPPALPK